MTRLEWLAGGVAVAGVAVAATTGAGAFGVVGAFVFACAFAPRLGRALG